MKAPLVRSPRKAKGQGGERREEILDAALSLFTRDGLHAVSTRQIAEAAGISQPALYAYFATKDDLIADLCVRAFATLSARMAAAKADWTPSQACFDKAMRVYIDFGLENPDAYRVAFMIEKSHDGTFLARTGGRAMQAGVEAFGAFLGMVADLQAHGLTLDEDPERLTQTLWAALHGLVSLLVARPEFPWVERESLIAAHIAMLRRGALRPG